jgi:hypothetical protein
MMLEQQGLLVLPQGWHKMMHNGKVKYCCKITRTAQWHFPTAGVPFFLAKTLRLSYPSTDVLLYSPLDSFSEAIESRNATDRAVGGH